MTDEELLALYQQRNQHAIAKTAEQYGSYCYAIAHRILQNRQDAEECVNDTWLRAWNSIPPQHPTRLSAYLGKITRNLALNRFKVYTTEKRGGSEVVAALDELAYCIPSPEETESVVLAKELSASISQFLSTLTSEKRTVFLRRYWYLCSVQEIARMMGVREGRISTMLHRMRCDLRTHLQQEGIVL